MTLRPVVVMFVFGFFFAAVGGTEPIDSLSAESVARTFVAERSTEHVVVGHTELLGASGRVVLHVFALEPAGFVLLAGDSTLPPVIGHSLRNAFPVEGKAFDQIGHLLIADVELRLEQAPRLPRERLEERRYEWQRLEAGRAEKHGLDYWPPAGATSTGGWVEVQWKQSAPYSDDCPVDPSSGTRSAAGCPAVAMAQIVDHHRSTNHTRLDDGDDYYHSYGGRNYWIDNDWQARDFPSFPALASSLDALDGLYRAGQSADAAGAAALVFACGVAAHQVYASSGSGTFGVAQAVQAYDRFGYYGFELLDENDADLYPRMEQNMKDGRPVHLAVVDPGWSTGHNVVVDGYCSDGTFHLNFGWGGPNDGWYDLPDEMPYGLTVVEGAIVDLVTFLFSDGFEVGDISVWGD